jgi:hypothetical protein
LAEVLVPIELAIAVEIEFLKELLQHSLVNKLSEAEQLPNESRKVVEA